MQPATATAQHTAAVSTQVSKRQPHLWFKGSLLPAGAVHINKGAPTDTSCRMGWGSGVDAAVGVAGLMTTTTMLYSPSSAQPSGQKSWAA
jgi:hypothetical protein